MQNRKIINKSKLIIFLEKFEFLFFWLRLFYSKSKGISWVYLMMRFFPQKILRINGRVKWPVHFTSQVLYHKNIKIGNRSMPGNNIGCYIQGRAGIIIGHNLRMGPNVGLISSNHDTDDYDQWIDAGPIEIGDNVWLGMNSVVMPGIKIGNNVVVAANSVVSKNVSDNSIVAGMPAQIVKQKHSYKGQDYSNI